MAISLMLLRLVCASERERGNQLVRLRRRRRVLCPCRSKLSGSAGICIIKMLKKPAIAAAKSAIFTFRRVGFIVIGRRQIECARRLSGCANRGHKLLAPPKCK